MLVVSGILYAHQSIIVVISAGCAAVASAEFCRLMHRSGSQARMWALLLSSVAAVVMTGFNIWDLGAVSLFGILGLMLIVAAIPYLFWFNFRDVSRMAFSEVVGLLYLGLTLSYIPLITVTGSGRIWLLYGLIVVSSTDTGAFIIGRLFGKHQLAPAISPAKTMEGALGGLASGVLFSMCLSRVFPFGMSLTLSILMGVLLSVIGQVGDLVESKLKRIARVKNSGRIIPGQGGILDRIDSVVLVLPVLYHTLSMGVT